MGNAWERVCENCWYYDDGYCDAHRKNVSPRSNCPEFTSKNDED